VNGLKLRIGVLGHKEHVYDIKMGTLPLPEKLIFTNLVTSGDNFDRTIVSGMVQNMGIGTSTGSIHTEMTELWQKMCSHAWIKLRFPKNDHIFDPATIS
jgi:hypothetical protein